MCDGTSQSNAPWVLTATQALNDSGSWTGRIHLHKLLYLTEALGLASPPFEFVLYDYGPYSFELDAEIIDLELFGLLERSYPKPGYGPRYEVSAQGKPVARQLAEMHRASIARAARAIGKRKGGELELIATCLWVIHDEEMTEPGAIVRRVLEAKPKYMGKESEVHTALGHAREIEKALASQS